MRPEAKAKRKIEALERRRALIDHMIEFIRTHPNPVDGADLHSLANRTGLRYDFAVIRPLWDKGRIENVVDYTVPILFSSAFWSNSR
jgi:hypothetical protein